MKKQKKALGKEKASLEKEDVEMDEVKIEEESLEKGKPGKHGPRKASLVPADTLEKERQLKAKLQESLEKARAEGGAAAGGTGSSSRSTSRPAGPMQHLEKAKTKEVIHICVDWHNTLEKDDDVSAENLAALTCLLQVAEVHLISYASRKKPALKDMQRLPKYGDVASTRAIFTQLGENGKVHWAYHLGCTVIVDDQPEIIKEAREWGLDAYGIKAKHRGLFWATFAEAVLDYLDLLSNR